MEQIQPTDHVARGIWMRAPKRQKRKGKWQFRPASIEPGDWILAHDLRWQLRVVSVGVERKRRRNRNGTLSSQLSPVTMVGFAGFCKVCGRMDVYRRALSNIRGPVACVACKDRRRERKWLRDQQLKAFMAVRVEAVLDGWDFGLEK